MEEREPRLDVYTRRHPDGDWMLMIRNNKTGRCYAKGGEEYIYAIRERILDEAWEKRKQGGHFLVLMRYYRIAYRRNIYVMPAI